MDTINDKVEELVSAIQESTEYQNFQEAERGAESTGTGRKDQRILLEEL